MSKKHNGTTYAIFVRTGITKSGRDLGNWTAAFATPQEAHEAAKKIKGTPYTMSTVTPYDGVGYCGNITYL